MFRGKESSNRIELSRLVQDFLNFGVLGSLRLWGWGVVGACPHRCAHPCACTHMHTCTSMRGKHDNFMQMAAPIGGIPGIPYDVICACVCTHAHVWPCVWEAPSHHPHPHSPTHRPPGGPPESVKIQ